MEEKAKLPHAAWVLVGDGRKALLMRNDGDAVYPDLVVKQVLDGGPNPPTHAQGTDVPGRAIHHSQRSAVEQTDWHDRAEADFAKEMAEAVATLCEKEAVQTLIVVAPPRALANLRKSLSPVVKAVVTAEINKDLINMPPNEITRHLAGD